MNLTLLPLCNSAMQVSVWGAIGVNFQITYSLISSSDQLHVYRHKTILFKTTVFLLLCLFAMTQWSSAMAAFPLGQNTLAPMLEKVTPGVVNISTRTRIRLRDNPLLSDPFFRRFFDLPDTPRQRESQSLGSGVVVNARNGLVLTNHHVVDKADEIMVTLQNGRKLEAELVGSDAESDVAVIRLRTNELTAVPMGDSDRLRVGDFVVAIGSPFGLSQTVTSGIISALGRTGLGIEGYEDFIQTDASINPGNSGGALVNLDGELIGLNTAIVGPGGGNVGIGFAIPINMARQLMDQIVQYGEVRRGQLGVHIQDLTPELATAMKLGAQRGALIAQVLPDSSADQAGLKPGDLVVRVNDRKVDDAASLRNIIGLMRVGEKVKLEFIRNGKQSTVSALLVAPEEPSKSVSKLSGYLQGVSFSAIDQRHPLYGKVEGVVVSDIERSSPAANAGLRTGDIITSINRRPVKDPSDVRAATEVSRDSLVLNVRRGNDAFFLLLR